MNSTTNVTFDVWHEDGLVFEDSPKLFIDLEATPIIFTVRGIAYFAPRFKHVGIIMGDLNTKAEFEGAYKRWLDVEFVLLNEKINAAASATHAPNDHQVLQGILSQGIDQAEAAMARLEHSRRAELKLV